MRSASRNFRKYAASLSKPGVGVNGTRYGRGTNGRFERSRQVRASGLRMLAIVYTRVRKAVETSVSALNA